MTNSQEISDGCADASTSALSLNPYWSALHNSVTVIPLLLIAAIHNAELAMA